jgi:hypothetical protein
MIGKNILIIHLDLNGRDFRTVDNMEKSFQEILLEEAKYNNVTLQLSTPANMFHELIVSLNQRDGDVVILLDEYDKPILNNISKDNCLAILESLKIFYSVIKAKERFIHCVFITGVSKSCLVSLFSDLNNLTDITRNSNFATMLGYTQEELEKYYGEEIIQLSQTLNTNINDLKHKIKNWYHGYCFHENAPRVYNPVSIINFFLNNGAFENFWFSTGTPTFLLDLIKNKQINIRKILETPVSDLAFETLEIHNLKVVPLLIQTGYLTIDKTFERYDELAYMLKFPNIEVEKSFFSDLSESYNGIDADEVKDSIFDLIDKVSLGNVAEFMEILKTFFAKIPYDVHLKNENNFQIIFYLIFCLLGLKISAESKTNSGRIDAVVTNNNFVFIFEFKLDKNANIALQQIKERDYYRKYMNSGKQISLIGVIFDKKAGQISSWIHETI